MSAADHSVSSRKGTHKRSKASQTRSEAPQAPLELEAATSEPSRPLEVSEEVIGLSIPEAATAYGTSVSTIRRRISKGELFAVKVPGPKGAEYRIPPGSMEALGYKLSDSFAGSGVKASKLGLELEELRVKVRELEASIVESGLRREAAERELEAVRANLSDLREALAKLPRAIEAAPRRKLFGRR